MCGVVTNKLCVFNQLSPSFGLFLFFQSRGYISRFERYLFFIRFDMELFPSSCFQHETHMLS